MHRFHDPLRCQIFTEQYLMQARRDFINLLLASSLAGSAFSAFAQQPLTLLKVSCCPHGDRF
jgi:hypothetical protein